jgi:hypothetical protein
MLGELGGRRGVFCRTMIMRKLLLVGMGLCLFGALWRAEEEEDGMAVALSPFLAALALEAGIFLLRRHQTSLLGASRPRGHIA